MQGLQIVFLQRFVQELVLFGTTGSCERAAVSEFFQVLSPSCRRQPARPPSAHATSVAA